MAETLPRAVKVWMGANILQIEFDNGQTRFMRTHFIDNYVSSWSPSKGKGKRINFFVAPTWEWLGANARIESDGKVTLFEKDTYTPEELWHNSKSSIDQLSGIN
ncbi:MULTISPECIES: hypothetical protein [Lacticaseibacillus]|uniref:Uncharacterized protein n=1 Tax=Lacticaseibacillus zeae subsp. silagei TaxID=3068307 RepID=A0ABD7Z5D1_LACZE|nr:MULTISPECIES: hypothetical protein [Lacticaseibacillus]OFR95162.1 hypothetical protein HMPREF2861_10260 [Lactobacillus sp. HMSC068F07]MDE3282464.1 hypothetical protein [Lacticaseibacillus casei]MDE3315232.1 hypothetical protein [Lacticaseibacillus zeae]WLV82353.1 hypothetical protein LACZS2_001505 [Lacticaseibacillus sp. NCIMB 15475]WLV85200.1 hypothetical protein LACZS1_001573 [Lacticaseibacillus sp. NCIMB 15474]